jgi:hypothetical protein
VEQPGHGNRPVRTFVATLSLLAALLFGGMAVGLAIALGPGGGSIGAIVVGFFALPLCFGLGMTAWRGAAGAWMVGTLVRAMIRSRGDEATFRDETVGRLRRAGGVLPGTWVFLPTALVVGLGSGIAMFVASAGDRLLAGGALFLGCVACGLILRRLARRGLLPMPEE